MSTDVKENPMADIKVINLGMVNVYLILSEHPILVDTGMNSSYNKILKSIKQFGVDPKSIELIILTHGHADHFGSAHSLSEVTGAKVLVHKIEYDCMINHAEDDVIPFTLFAKFILWMGTKLSRTEPNEPEYEADILIEDTYSLEDYGVNGKIVHTPGHTKGSISVLMDDGDVLIGDNLMAMMPFSKPGKPMLAYSIPKIKESIDMLIQMGAKHFYLSHGKDYSLEVIQKALKKL